MTNTEAITKLTNIMHDDHYAWHPSILEAFRMAVDALRGLPSAQPSFPQRHENDHLVEVSKKGDTIYRAEAIKALGEEPEVWTGNDEYAQGLNNQWHYDVNALKSVPSAQPEQRWIPCSERLPSYGEDVLISIGGYCNVGYIVSVNEEEQYNWFFSGWYHSPNDVDAWMPLPEPYREEGETE